MDTTPVTLLERLRQPRPEAAWTRFVQLYTPVLYHWAQTAGLQESDAADLVQDVFALLLKKLPDFQYEPGKGFRGWLKTVTLNKWREQRRRAVLPMERGANLDGIACPAEAEAFWETDYRKRLAARALALMKADFQPVTWQACWAHAALDKPAAVVASELGISVGAVYAAKFRVLTRLRQELDGLLD